MSARNYSRKREAILAKICATTCHPTAEWVYQELKGDYPDLSLGTVYRNIGLFKEEGVICSVGTVAGQERFDGNVAPHGHFVCQTCRTVLDIEATPEQTEVGAYVEKALGVFVDRVDLTVYGRCKACEAAK